MTGDILYAYYPVFARSSHLVQEAGSDMSAAAGEWEILLKEHEADVEVRGFYSCEGFRADADMMMWWIARTPEAIQDLLLDLRRSDLGRDLELTWSFMGVTRPSEFAPDHQPAFVRGEDPRKYLCVYPFVRSPEWYLLHKEDRGRMLREHGEMGREFPDVLANTTSAFGLGDWEWILAFEADEMPRIVDCIRRLREAEARRYTKEEVPFVIGVRRDLREAVEDLA